MIEVVSIRNKLLDLALCGKLTEQFDEDGDVNTLVKEIESIRQELVEQGIVKKEKNTLEITDDNIPFDIPSSWTWMRVSEVAYLTSGKPYEEVQSGELYIKVSDMNIPENETSITTSEHFVSENNIGRISRYSIIFPKRGGAIATNKKRIVVDKEIFIDLNTMSMTIIKPEIFPYVKLWFDSLKLDELQTGTSIPQINNKDIYPLMIPIPPLKEQGRIVRLINKVDEYLKLIEELQIDYIENTEVLKRKLIDAGIQGKLTEQLFEDGAVEEVHGEECISESDMLMKIPVNWKWIRLGWAMEIERGGSPRPIKTFMTDSQDGINWIKIGDVAKDGKYILHTKEKIKPEGEKRSRRVYPGDFLLTNSMSFGRPYISRIEGCIHDGWLLLRNSKGLFDLDYLYWLLSSQYVYNQFCKKASGATVDNLNKEKVASAVVPLPPICEQKRIASRIEQIMQLISQESLTD